MTDAPTFYLDWHPRTTANVLGRTFYIHVATQEHTGRLHLAKIVEKDRWPHFTVYFPSPDPTVREIRQGLVFATCDATSPALNEVELTALAIEVVGVAALTQEYR